MVKSKLPPQKASLSRLEAVESMKKGHKVYLLFIKRNIRIIDLSTTGKIILFKGRTQVKLGLGCRQSRIVSCCIQI